MYIHIYIYIYTRVYAHTCVCVYIYIYIYICTHTKQARPPAKCVGSEYHGRLMVRSAPALAASTQWRRARLSYVCVYVYVYIYIYIYIYMYIHTHRYTMHVCMYIHI